MRRKGTEARSAGFVVWLTGLPGAGKTTIASAVARRLRSGGCAVEQLDGDILRKTLCRDLGFSRHDRAANIARAAYIASVLSRHGIGVVASFVSPYRKERNLVRATTTNFIEVYVNTPLSICEQRDHHGLYARARRGDLPNFTGISDPYEAPKNPELVLPADRLSVDECAAEIVRYLAYKKLVSSRIALKEPARRRADQ